MKRLSPITRYKLRKLLKYALVTATTGSVLMLFGGQAGWKLLGAWALLGIWTGVLEEFLFRRRFRSLAIPLQFIGKALAVNLFTVAVLGIAWLAGHGRGGGVAEGVRLPLEDVVTSIGIYRFALQAVVITSVAILVVQVEEFMGRRFFMGFLLGWYDKPRVGERVLLSIDLVGSSALNERLGDLLYFRFLNLTHSLMTDAVLRHDAEIHKYVGDEVIFIWDMGTGLQAYNCLALFFDIQERLEAHRPRMLREFGVAPQFRGAVHGGRVITAQVGHIKRAIDLSGDVMNTVSRVLSLAKSQHADLMVTQEIVDRMPGAHLSYHFGEPMPMRVKGGKRELMVRTVQKLPGTGPARRSGARKAAMAISTVALLLPLALWAQTPVPLVTSYGQFAAFSGGEFRELEGRKPQAVFQGGNKLAYINDAGDLKLYTDGKVTTLERGGPVDVAVSRNLMAWQYGPALRVPLADGASTICRQVGRFSVGDSLIAFIDQMQHQMKVMWKGNILPVADVLMDSDVPWKSGSNTLLLYDQGRKRVLLFYRGRVSTLCNGDDPSRSVPGGDVVAFMDEYDNTFRIFDKGEQYEVEAFAPQSFQVGEGLAALVNTSGTFRCYQGGRMWDIMDFAPDEYWVRDSVVVFRDRNQFKAYSNGAVETLERNMPAQWNVVGGLVAWTDERGVLKAFRAGKRYTVGTEAGIGEFQVYPGTITYKSNSGDTKVWWNGKLYSHY